MTTIAYDGVSIAYDGRMCHGQTILDDNSQKMHVSGGVRFFLCGSVPDEADFVKYWLSGEKPPREIKVDAIVVDAGKVYYCGATEDGIWKQLASTPTAIGSGADHALTAMDLNLTALTAVKMAAKRDTKTGGKIRQWRVK